MGILTRTYNRWAFPERDILDIRVNVLHGLSYMFGLDIDFGFSVEALLVDKSADDQDSFPAGQFLPFRFDRFDEAKLAVLSAGKSN